MRVTKKFAGASSIGKQVFQPIDADKDGYAHELDELDMLRVLFHRRVCDPTEPYSTSLPQHTNFHRKPSVLSFNDESVDGDYTDTLSSASGSYGPNSTKFMRRERDKDVITSRLSSSLFSSLSSSSSASSSSSSSSLSSIYSEERFGLSPKIGSTTAWGAGIPNRKLLGTSSSSSSSSMMEKGGNGGGVKRVASAPDFSDYLRQMHDTNTNNNAQYGTDNLYGNNGRNYKMGTSTVKRSQSLMGFEQYFDNADLAGDLLLQFAGGVSVPEHEEYSLDGGFDQDQDEVQEQDSCVPSPHSAMAIDSLSHMKAVAATDMKEVAATDMKEVAATTTSTTIENN